MMTRETVHQGRFARSDGTKNRLCFGVSTVKDTGSPEMLLVLESQHEVGSELLPYLYRGTRIQTLDHEAQPAQLDPETRIEDVGCPPL